MFYPRKDHDIKIDENDRQHREESLSGKVVRGGMWVFALRITNRGLGFIRTIILARLLAPEDFGLLGIAMLAISTLETFSQTGFQTALIQKKDNVESYLDTAWTVSAIRGTVLFSILFFSAPIVAKFFNSPQAILIIKVIAISTLLSGFRNIGLLYFQKELEFNKQFVFSLATTLTNLSVSVSLAFVLRNVWALVWGGLAANLVGLFLSYILHPYRPRIVIDKEKFRDLFGFGKWVVGSGILVFLITQGDDIFVGKMLGVTALGLYQMAYTLSNLPATEITHVISQVTFPAYSKLQNDLSKIREAYLKVLQVTVFISIPLAAGIFVLAPDFAKIFLGEKWLPMVPAMRVLVLSGLVRSVQATTGPVFLAVSRPEIEPRWQMIRLLIMAVLIYALTSHWGLLGASIAVLTSTVVSTIGFALMVLRVTKCRIYSFIQKTIFPFINALFMTIILLMLSNFISSVNMWVFFCFVSCGIITYLLGAYIMDRTVGYGMKRLIKETLESF